MPNPLKTQNNKAKNASLGKVLVLNASDRRGGASVAAMRIFQAVRRIHPNSVFSAPHHITGYEAVLGSSSNLQEFLRPGLSSLIRRLSEKRWPTLKGLTFTTFGVPGGFGKILKSGVSDIVHLHWLSFGTATIKTIAKIDRPIVWTMHDMETFTGGCHYSGLCDRFSRTCGSCPILGSQRKNDQSTIRLKKKLRYWKKLNIRVVCPSRWMADSAKKSSLFANHSVTVVPNCVDIERFRPVDKRFSREVLGLPLDRPIILFGADRGVKNPLKGFSYLVQALERFSFLNPDFKPICVVFGCSGEKEMKLPIETFFLGSLSDEVSICLAFNAADVFVIPSLQDNFPNTIIESMACGTPVVAFSVGGIPEMIKHEETGFLAAPRDAESLCEGIKWIFSDFSMARAVAQSARNYAVENFNYTSIANAYINEYNLAKMAALSRSK